MPYGELYYVRWVGVDPADGQQIWLDKDGNETKTYSEDNAVFTGKQRYAPWAGGFSTSFFWKGFSINADFSYVLGKYTINNDAFFYNNPNFAGQLNQSTDMLDMWTTPGQVTNIPAGNSELRFDTHLIENASFLRLKNLTIGYTLPENWLHKTGFIKGARIFAVGRNLLTVTPPPQHVPAGSTVPSDLSIMPGGKAVRAHGTSRIPHGTELDAAIADHTGIRRLALLIRANEIRNDRLPKLPGKVGVMKRNP